jgi:hypothetical protein
MDGEFGQFCLGALASIGLDHGGKFDAILPIYLAVFENGCRMSEIGSSTIHGWDRA